MTNSNWLAHIAEDGREQSVKAHCRNTATYASQAMSGSTVLSSCGFLAGLVHDAGKYTTQFQHYLLEGNGCRGSVNHTFTGVRLLLERYFTQNAEDFSAVACEVLALAAGEHHGCFDCVDQNQKSGFRHRLTKEGIGYEEAVENFLQDCTSPEELDLLFQKACKELAPVLEKLLSMTNEDSNFYNDETAFYSGLLVRLLLSSVIEGDRRDTAEFMSGIPFPKQQDIEALQCTWDKCLSHVEKKLDGFPQDTSIQQARRSISEQCRQAAGQPGGVVRLNVPTGGGKTLSSLRYALAHAKNYKKQRIIFVSPLLSILDQNASEIRKFIQDDSLILEHHSNLIRTQDSVQNLDNAELLMESWTSPIIITTLVQFLNTLFSGKTSAIRRFHSLQDSIIVIDEVQTVPSKMLSLFSLAINFLSEICNATVVLCSATQPCMEQIEHPLHTPIPDLIPYSRHLWDIFQRTDIQYIGEKSLEGIGQFALEQLKTSLLIICNKKSQAEQLFHLLQGGNFDLFLLSAAMCVQHRRDTLDKLRTSLNVKEQKVICVSTQVIEAGVDISFGCVIRLTAGMDSVVQAAGRCNRNGEAGPGVLAPVYLVGLQNENLGKLPDIQFGKSATQDLLAEFQNHPAQYACRLDSDRAITYYYQTLYRKMPEHTHDYVLPQGGPSLFSLLSLNDCCLEESPYYFRQAFRTAGAQFQVFEENTTDVIVPYEKGKACILDLCSAKAAHDLSYLKTLLDQVKPFSVSLYQYQIDLLNKCGGLLPLPGGALALNGHYSEETGLSLENTELEFMEV